MSAVVKEFHTHAKGEMFGWWGSATHSVHLDEKGEPIEGTEWRENISGASNLVMAVIMLEDMIREHIHDTSI